MDAGELCTRKTVIISEDKSVKTAAMLMKQYNVGSLVVVRPLNNHNIPVGIITDRDIILNVIADNKELESIKVHRIMSAPVITVQESTTLYEALMKMRYSGIRRVPVINEKGLLTGILSVDDILDNISKELNEITQIFKKEEPAV